MPDRNSLGGPAACEPPFVEELRRMGLEVAEETYVYGDRLERTNLRSRVARVLRTARHLRRRLDAGRFDLLHLNTSFDTRALFRDVPTVMSLRRASGSKIFLKFHGSDARLLETKNPLLRALGRSLLRRADAVGVLSSEERENFVRAGAEARKVFVVKNVVEDAARYVRSPSFAERLKLPPDVPLLLFIARFIPAKGLLEVVRACAILRERGYDFRLLCLGDGPARAAAEAEVARLDLQAHARFLGYIPEAETRDFYANSTALVFPTYHYEGFPMVVFNSLAAGLPIITTRIRAAADYLREPDNCLWVEARQPAMLAEKIARLLDQPETRAAMSRNNRALAQSFNAAHVAREYVQVYKIVTGDK
ncbi:MAG TPA: glycosyltransferase family 4 protein [Pyrinomonadaceae bacterium]|nr:glycosyltransferase family 4 protein [Pyrinomonadaceae bacterium]